jgi:hypothetical protein
LNRSAEVVADVSFLPHSTRVARSMLSVAVVVATVVVFAHTCFAQIDTANIGDNSFAGSKGVISLNVAAGVVNQQDNSALITDIPGSLSIEQSSTGNETPANTVIARIGSLAFSSSSGLMQVSEASGVGNLQANAAFIGLNASASEALTGISLSQMRATQVSSPGGLVPFQGEATISPSAFANTSGVVQLDMTAGNNNIAANLLSLHVGP